jgi:Alanine racemase, N-terminal domain
LAMQMKAAEQGRLDDRPTPVISVGDDLLRQVAAGDYIATLEPTRWLSEDALDLLFEATISACQRPVNICVTLKLFQHVRANLEYYVAYFSAKPQVAYFCTDRIEDAIRIRMCLDRLGRAQGVLLLYASAPELVDLLVKYRIEPCVFDPWWVEQALLHKKELTQAVKIHLWIDVGMAREGILPHDLGRMLPSLANDHIVVEGVATHFNAVVQDHTVQKTRFEDVLRALRASGIRPRVVHAIASHNGLGYSDLTGSLSPGKVKLDVLYDMIRPGCALGLGPRRNLGSHGEVLRLAIPIREARIAHIKDVPAGWNLGYWDNKLPATKRIAILEGTRLNSLRYEAFQDPGCETRTLNSVLSHGSVAGLDLAGGSWKAGDILNCATTMWMIWLTRGFERSEDGSCRIAIRDAVSEKISNVRIVIRKELPSEHLRQRLEQNLGLLLNAKLECVTRKRRMAWFARDLLARIIAGGLLLTNRIPSLAQRVNSVLKPISCS